MTEYICLVCHGKQYTSKTDDKDPCIYCGGPCIKSSELIDMFNHIVLIGYADQSIPKGVVMTSFING
jgi:hypothetical protein